jgi:hypothetical protein
MEIFPSTGITSSTGMTVPVYLSALCMKHSVYEYKWRYYHCADRLFKNKITFNSPSE